MMSYLLVNKIEMKYKEYSCSLFFKSINFLLQIAKNNDILNLYLFGRVCINRLKRVSGGAN